MYFAIRPTRRMVLPSKTALTFGPQGSVSDAPYFDVQNSSPPLDGAAARDKWFDFRQLGHRFRGIGRRPSAIEDFLKA